MVARTLLDGMYACLVENWLVGLTWKWPPWKRARMVPGAGDR